jgi:uncharacterized iron-regulated membrane protein
MLTAHRVRTWYRVHKWTSLICTAFLLIACLSGLPLIFGDEIDDWLQPYATKAVPPGTPDADIDKMVSVARSKLKGFEPISLDWDDDRPLITVYLSSNPIPTASTIRSLVFDQHTGSLLGGSSPNRSVTNILLRLHSGLFIDLPGELLMGLMALLFVISLVSGVLVYGPFMRRLPFGSFRRDAAVRTRWFDLHNLLGIVTIAWTLVVGATGVMNALSTPLFGAWRAQVLPAMIAQYRGKPAPSPASYIPLAPQVARVAAALPNKQVSSVGFPNPEFGSPWHYIIWTQGKTPLTAQLFTPAAVDVTNGKMHIADGLPWYLRLLEVSRPLHFGNYGGLPLKIIWALFDVVTIVVLISGVYLWLGKRTRPVESTLNRLVEMENASPALVS